MSDFSVNGRSYRLPTGPVAVVCVDGCEEEYLDVALEQGRMPSMARILAGGWRGTARGALPSFTNVNNAAIVTGAPPAVTGLSGNFFLDPDTGEEVMMNSADFLRCETILAAAASAGRKVAMVTAKEKLRDLLSPGLLTDGVVGMAFSSEKAAEASEPTHGISNIEALAGETPPIYSGEASVYVLRAGVALVEAGQADFLYLSLTDYIQHKFAPQEEGALEFYEALDVELGRLTDLGCHLGITADHGMNAKCRGDGTPRVIYLEDELSKEFGEGNKVICPITDPYVAHHGALGSYVTVHLAELGRADEIAEWVGGLEGVTEVLGKVQAADLLELPADRIGDLVVMSAADTVLGRSPEHHDLSQLDRPLRSHGGRFETMVPFIFSSPLNAEYAAKAASDPRNFDVFDYVCNGLEL
ncbi:uncharacterized protein METZ01_LOCUS71689 [marine metagenome]|uniref:Phosphonoacetate hydrolase n=1 Tax=marine metagenome TaxID=408172 RepID=A0A381TS11_9ZZZZ